MSTGIGCDFCLSDQAHVVYAMTPGRLPGDPSSMPGTALALDGPWTACQRCAALIEAGRWRTLLRRMRRGTAERRTTLDGMTLPVSASDGLGLAPGEYPALDVVCAQVLAYFRVHRIPPGRRVV